MKSGLKYLKYIIVITIFICIVSPYVKAQESSLRGHTFSGNIGTSAYFCPSPYGIEFSLEYGYNLSNRLYLGAKSSFKNCFQDNVSFVPIYATLQYYFKDDPKSIFLEASIGKAIYRPSQVDNGKKTKQDSDDILWNISLGYRWPKVSLSFGIDYSGSYTEWYNVSTENWQKGDPYGCYFLGANMSVKYYF